MMGKDVEDVSASLVREYLSRKVCNRLVSFSSFYFNENIKLCVKLCKHVFLAHWLSTTLSLCNILLKCMSHTLCFIYTWYTYSCHIFGVNVLVYWMYHEMFLQGLKKTIACMDEELPRTHSSVNNRSDLRSILHLEDLYKKNKVSN